MDVIQEKPRGVGSDPPAGGRGLMGETHVIYFKGYDKRWYESMFSNTIKDKSTDYLEHTDCTARGSVLHTTKF